MCNVSMKNLLWSQRSATCNYMLSFYVPFIYLRFIDESGRNHAICCNMNVVREYYTKWSELEEKMCQINDLIYMWNIQMFHIIYKYTKKVRDITTNRYKLWDSAKRIVICGNEVAVAVKMQGIWDCSVRLTTFWRWVIEVALHV